MPLMELLNRHVVGVECAIYTLTHTLVNLDILQVVLPFMSLVDCNTVIAHYALICSFLNICR